MKARLRITALFPYFDLIFLTGGDRVDGLKKLEDDPGISLYMGQIGQATGTKDRGFRRVGEQAGSGMV